MFGLKEQNISLNRKMLSEVARFEPQSFQVGEACAGEFADSPLI